MHKNESVLLKKTKTWTTVNIVILIIGVVISTISVISLFGMKATGFALFQGLPGGEEAVAMLEEATSPIGMALAVVLIIIDIALVVWFFKCNGRMKKNIVPEKLPYYISLVLYVLSQVYSLISGSNVQVTSGGVIFTIILALVFVWIRIMPLIHLRRIVTKAGEKIQETK